jgi:DNA-binding NarL/FixJ family response regulator
MEPKPQLNFQEVVRKAQRLLNEDRPGLRIPLSFPARKDAIQPTAVLLLKVLRLLGEKRPCLLSYDVKDSSKVEALRRLGAGAILNAPGTAVMSSGEFARKELDDARFWRAIGTFDASVMGYLGEDMFIDEAHDFKDMTGLKQLCDAADLCGIPLSVAGKVADELCKTPELYFLSQYVSVRLPERRSMALGDVSQQERNQIGALCKEVQALLSGKRVLIVEDDPLWAGALTEVLQGRAGRSIAQVIARGSDKQILEDVGKHMAKSEPPVALCVVDARLRPMSGNRNTWRKVVEAIRRCDKGVPILVLSVSRRPEDRIATGQLDADYLFPKDLGITPWEKLSVGDVGLRSVRHLKSLLSVIKLMCTSNLAMANRWSAALRAHMKDDGHWWMSHSFDCMQQDPKTKVLDPERLEVSLFKEEVSTTFEECLARYRRVALHEALMAMAGVKGFRPDPVDRANAVLALGRLIERVHAKDPFGASNIHTHHLGRYTGYGATGEGVLCGREDHLAELLYHMRHAAAHFSGMTAATEADWRAFFAGMFIWLVGTGETFPVLPTPIKSIESRRKGRSPWHADKSTLLRERLSGSVAHDKQLRELYGYLTNE